MVWLKTIGVAFVVAGFGVWGLIGAKRLGKRVEQLKNVRLAIGFLEKEITYMCTPLTRALEITAKFCDPPVSYLFVESAGLLKEKRGITAGEAWVKGIDKLRRHSDLKGEDIELLKTAAMQIGMSDTNEQHKFFALIQEELKLLEEKAREDAESGQKLWSYGGFILGTVIVLLLI